uniref:Uncharacterized protein n=1 Tax=Myotis myotis TaxID=51298 RepID=A0A7J7VIC6_MYOMY|nr:hypothetical protein mMyoMyo1_008393 [Myotis myotis]
MFSPENPPQPTFPTTLTLCNITHPLLFSNPPLPAPPFPQRIPFPHIPYSPTLCHRANHPSSLSSLPPIPVSSCTLSLLLPSPQGGSPLNTKIILKSNQVEFKLKYSKMNQRSPPVPDHSPLCNLRCNGNAQTTPAVSNRIWT